MTTDLFPQSDQKSPGRAGNGGARVSSGRGSKQDYGTPKAFIDAVEARYGKISWDLAAHAGNAKAEFWISEEVDSLSQPWHKLEGLLWLNPPFSCIKPWAEKCLEESQLGAKIALLTTASCDTIWWAQNIHWRACVYFLSPRIKFDGADDPFMKPLALSLFNVCGSGYGVWKWKP